MGNGNFFEVGVAVEDGVGVRVGVSLGVAVSVGRPAVTVRAMEVGRYSAGRGVGKSNSPSVEQAARRRVMKRTRVIKRGRFIRLVRERRPIITLVCE